MLSDIQPLLDASVLSLCSLSVLSLFVAVQTVRMRVAAGRTSTPEDDFLVQQKMKARDEKPRDTRPMTADAAAFVKIVAVLFVVPSSASMEDVDRCCRLHRHMTENNVTFLMTLAAIYLSLIKCQYVLSGEGKFDLNGTAEPVCSGLAATAATTVQVYVATRIAHATIYAASIRQPFRAIGFISGVAALGVMLYCVWAGMTVSTK